MPRPHQSTVFYVDYLPFGCGRGMPRPYIYGWIPIVGYSLE